MAVCFAAFGTPAGAQPGRPAVDAEVREAIRSRLERPIPVAGDEALRSPGLVRRFYEARGFDPAFSRAGWVGREAAELIDFVEQAARDGLQPSSYHVTSIRRLADRIRKAGPANSSRADLADVDLLLTDAFITYGGHLLVGTLDPVTLESRELDITEDVDLPSRLDAALSDRELAASLNSLVLGSEPGELRLREALGRYRRIAAQGGWPRWNTGGPELRRGDSGPDVRRLRASLLASGDYAAPGEARLRDTPAPASATVFDSTLETSVRRFQRRHGLPDDGVVDDATRAALGIPVEVRVRQIELNLERWRWLPRDLGSRYVLVNSADFTVDVVEDDRLVRRARAVVGSQFTPTPVFADTITYLVFNPTWRVPADIAAEEILPRAAEDPGFLQREGYRIIGADGRVLDPSMINWSSLDYARAPFRVEQAPGPRNALGRVKFMLPNPYNVYLHDTPERGLFAEASRARSHGCIRVEDAIGLAELLLAGDARWTRTQIGELLRTYEETTIALVQPMAVYLEYWTAWTEPDGTVHFREDVYDRDEVLDRILP